VRPGKKDLGPLGRFLNIENICADPLSLTVRFAGDLLPSVQYGLSPSHIDVQVTPLDSLHCSCDEFSFSVLILVVDVLSLRVSNPLNDDLLGSLGGDSSKIARIQLDPKAISDLCFLVQFPSLLEGDFILIIFHGFNNCFELE